MHARHSLLLDLLFPSAGGCDAPGVPFFITDEYSGSSTGPGQMIKTCYIFGMCPLGESERKRRLISCWGEGPILCTCACAVAAVLAYRMLFLDDVQDSLGMTSLPGSGVNNLFENLPSPL